MSPFPSRGPALPSALPAAGCVCSLPTPPAGFLGLPVGSGEGCAGFLLASHWGLSHAGSSCPFLLEVLDHIHVAVFLAGTSR